MTDRGRATRERLIAAGEALVARDGLEAVTIAEVTAAAGQRNGAAVHYHFGGRDGLLRAIVARHQNDLDAVRRDRLDRLDDRSGADVRALIAIVVETMASELDTDSGRAFLRIQADRVALAGGPLADPAPSMTEIIDRLTPLLAHLDPSVAAERARLVTAMVTDRLGRRAEEEASGTASPDRHTVVTTLVDAVTAVLLGPVTPTPSPAPRSAP